MKPACMKKIFMDENNPGRFSRVDFLKKRGSLKQSGTGFQIKKNIPV